MDAFGFTQKKWQGLSETTQHRHLIEWLSGFYQKLVSNRMGKRSLDLFAHQYNLARAWSGLPSLMIPESTSVRLWIEAVSDAIQYHRTCIGTAIRDHDLAVDILKDDLPLDAEPLNLDCHIALDGLRSLFNIGSIFRICDAAGFDSVILGNTPGKEDSRIAKTAMGAEKWVLQEKTTDLYDTLMKKKKQGYRIVGVETAENAVLYDETEWSPKTILLFGNEEYGISSHILPVCDAFVTIPMFGRKNSINVANAAGIVCFHATRSLLKKKAADK